MEYINHTGGANGADLFWEIEGIKYGVKSISYSFKGHNSKSKNQKILTNPDLMEGWDVVGEVSKKMGRDLSRVSSYVQNLLSRNWFQVKCSDSIFAIGYLMDPHYKDGKYINPLNRKMVRGGTGYAVEMAIYEFKENIYVFDQDKKSWFKWDNKDFISIDYIPILTERFAGIGTRDLSEEGRTAIKNVYKNTFK